MERLTQRWEAAGVLLGTDLLVPSGPGGVVVLAGAGLAGRDGARNRLAAEQLALQRIATVAVDLLTTAETGHAAGARLDVGLLTGRLSALADQLAGGVSAGLPLGLFGIGPATAAALTAAARRPERVRALVCQGGRPDRVSSVLSSVRVPTRLIFGERDEQGSPSGHRAAAAIAGRAEVLPVPDAAGDLAEPGAWEQAAKWAADWFGEHLAHPVPPL